MKTGKIYIWFDRRDKRFYIGSKFSNDVKHDEYKSSSKYMNIEYEKRPRDFKRRYLETGIMSGKECMIREAVWLSRIPPEQLNKRYYNRINYNRYSLPVLGFHGNRCEETNLIHSGENHVNYGKKGRDSVSYGMKRSPETCRKIGLIHKGKKVKPESIAKSVAGCKKFNIENAMTCEWCSKTINPRSYRAYHGKMCWENPDCERPMKWEIEFEDGRVERYRSQKEVPGISREVITDVYNGKSSGVNQGIVHIKRI